MSENGPPQPGACPRCHATNIECDLTLSRDSALWYFRCRECAERWTKAKTVDELLDSS